MEYQNHQMENKCSFEWSFRWKKILYWARRVIFPKRAKLWPHKKGNNISFYKNATCGNNISKSDYSLTSALRLFWKIHIAFLLFFSFLSFWRGWRFPEILKFFFRHLTLTKAFSFLFTWPSPLSRLNYIMSYMFPLTFLDSIQYKKSNYYISSLYVFISIPAGIYLLKVNSKSTRIRREICSKLTINILKSC